MAPTATPLALPVFKKLAGKRVVLASSSPRRKDVLANVGFEPEIVPSTFAEDLPKADFRNRLAEYPVATAGEKALEVYERLVRTDDRNPPDLVISADTVVIFPPEADTAPGGAAAGETSEVLEKPVNAEDQRAVLRLMAGRSCEVVTGVCIGYKLESISCSTLVQFYDNSDETIDAYIAHGEGHDRAGGFAIQGLGGLLIDRIDGSYDNTVGFPSSMFWRWIAELDAEGVFDEV